MATAPTTEGSFVEVFEATFCAHLTHSQQSFHAAPVDRSAGRE
jgi:hypothetical protein